MKQFTVIHSPYVDYFEEVHRCDMDRVIAFFLRPEFQSAYPQEVLEYRERLNAMQRGDHFVQFGHIVICKDS